MDYVYECQLSLCDGSQKPATFAFSKGSFGRLSPFRAAPQKCHANADDQE